MFTDVQLLQAVLELHKKCDDRFTCEHCQFRVNTERNSFCAVAHPNFWKINYLKEEKNETVN